MTRGRFAVACGTTIAQALIVLIMLLSSSVTANASISFPLSWNDATTPITVGSVPILAAIGIGKNGVFVVVNGQVPYFVVSLDGGRSWRYARNDYGCTGQEAFSCGLRRLYVLLDGRIVLEYDSHTMIVSSDLTSITPLRHPYVNAPARASLQPRNDGGDWLMVDQVTSDTRYTGSHFRRLLAREPGETSWSDTGVQGLALVGGSPGTLDILSTSSDITKPETVASVDNNLTLRWTTTFSPTSLSGFGIDTTLSHTTRDGKIIILQQGRGIETIDATGSVQCLHPGSQDHPNLTRISDSMIATSNIDSSGSPSRTAVFSSSTDFGCNWKTISVVSGPVASFLIGFNDDTMLIVTFSLHPPTRRAFQIDASSKLVEVQVPPWIK